MLEQVLDYIHNWFVHDIYSGSFTISGGVLQDVELLEGQYFKINGSILNDGLHSTSDSLSDETFNGEVWGLSIPTAIISIANEISAWMNQYGESLNSPYASESFGGYSYSKSAGGGGGGNGGYSVQYPWAATFGSRLNAYRKINNDFVLKR